MVTTPHPGLGPWGLSQVRSRVGAAGTGYQARLALQRRVTGGDGTRPTPTPIPGRRGEEGEPWV